MEAVTIRLAYDADAAAIERVAGRDSRPVPPAPHLVAIRGDTIEAALSLGDGAVVADPFRHTADLVELLRCHARALEAAAEPPAGSPAGAAAREALRPTLASAGGCA
jgi:hypothetical protein